ncbi:hypothetical protein SNOG_01356 [Parastagonospora nodorum SN15]|uniref:Uncharacterized protein n=1 Tax=Phaeosphaeria nodorum (strain SN15 / ATCC MYA-4574 / FGSC 10173) TaxID=321614 RepID=Q0V3Q8_PHANO|nr:hypothetical protein SNOG_01356 [Parastagonospora nodorum SN15]EAT91005.2 hypothetical protein SNOG_01356 [Parastagonospora nodorum SN15]
MQVSRPKSMPDFSALLDASTPLFEARAQNRRQTSPVRGQGYPRKKVSISLAAGLIMNENQKNAGALDSPYKQSLDGTQEEEQDVSEDALFHAYALKVRTPVPLSAYEADMGAQSDFPNSPPYILTFASAAICTQWWALVRREYSDAMRPSPQLFVMKSDELEHINDNLRFYGLRNKWFLTGQDNLSNTSPVIPLQSADGRALAPTQQPHTERPSSSSSASASGVESLTEKLDRLASVVEKNVEQIHALSVAQSAGLQRMQEINETNTAQIMGLADQQAKLQALIDQNASHYIALSNNSFESQEQIKTVMKTTATQIQSLSKNQAQLANTCDGMMRGIDNLAASISQMNVGPAPSETSSAVSSPVPSGVMGNRITPPPRKLNRRIKGVWYEYDMSSTTPTSSPKKSVGFTDTLSKSPATPKKA